MSPSEILATLSLCVIYWPSTAPSIKRYTCVNKRKNRGSRWALENNITRCPRRFKSVGDRMPVGEPACRLRASVTHVHYWSRHYLLIMFRIYLYMYTCSCMWLYNTVWQFYFLHFWYIWVLKLKYPGAWIKIMCPRGYSSYLFCNFKNACLIQVLLQKSLFFFFFFFFSFFLSFLLINSLYISLFYFFLFVSEFDQKITRKGQCEE